MTTSTTTFNDADDCRNCGARFDQHAMITELCMTGDNCFVPVISDDNEDDQITQLFSQIATMTNELDDAKAELVGTRLELGRVQTDLQTVTDSRDRVYTEAATLRAQMAKYGPGGEANMVACRYASEYDLCGQFDTVADEIGWWNRHDQGGNWWRPEIDWRAYVDVSLSVRVSLSLDGYVTSDDAENAIDSDMLRAELRDNGIRCDFDITDYDVTEVDEA